MFVKVENQETFFVEGFQVVCGRLIAGYALAN